jgi:crotonobetainyl-CoA:carnitine CoA-transferase CaiB-like acyl-CoA transferase
MDLVVQAMAGHISITGDDDGAPAKAAVPVVDLSVGLYMTIAVLTGLYRREAEGVGSYAETSLFHGGLSLLNYLAAYSMTAGEHLQRWGTAHPGSVPSQVFACVDGLVAVDASFDEHFRSLCGALEVPELADDPRFVDRKSRGENRRDLVARLAEEFGRRTADEVLALLAEIDIPCGPVLDVPAALAFADSLGYPAIAEFEVEGAPVKALATPIWFRGADQPRRSPPAIGADAISILTEVLGYDETMARETIVKQRSPAARSHEPSDEGLAGATAAHAQRD